LVHIAVKVRIADFQGIAPSERLEVFRQICGARHRRVLDERWDDSDSAPKRCGDFLPDKVFRIVQPPLSCSIGACEPLPSEERD
jgi:hypothetical protein